MAAVETVVQQGARLEFGKCPHCAANEVANKLIEPMLLSLRERYGDEYVAEVLKNLAATSFLGFVNQFRSEQRGMAGTHLLAYLIKAQEQLDGAPAGGHVH